MIDIQDEWNNNYFKLLYLHLTGVVSSYYCEKQLEGAILPVIIEMIKPIEETVKIGGSLNISCTLESPGSSIQWLRNDKLLFVNSSSAPRRYWNIVTDNEVLITISDVTKKDNGLWECIEVGGKDGTIIRKTKVLKLIVTKPPDETFLEMKGKKLPAHATISIEELTMVSVKCMARYAVPPVQQIYWTLDTNNISSRSEFLVEFLPKNDTYISWSVVTFNVTRILHKKQLVCYVHHHLWPQAVVVSASLNVSYVPSFSISRVPPFGFPVVEGMSVFLKCDVDSNPPGVPKWLKDDGPLQLLPSLDGILNFTSINRHHSGWYKYDSEIVQHPAVVPDTHPSDPFRLQCKAGGKPLPPHCWTRIRENNQVEGVSIEQDLLLNTVLYSDTREYKCITSNIIGRRLYTSETKDLSIKVKGRPKIDPINRTLNAIAGRSAKLFFRFCGNPRPHRAHWIVHHLALSPGDRSLPYIAHNITESETPHCYLCTLEITEVSQKMVEKFYFLPKILKELMTPSFY
ncbi:hemicentin-1-like isoform X2 [Tachypleus tridentatus]|uniref:hemicentin-1-like isoform X2 n=2 Tax=Tachypleus tridentatus TaxID=6853 RepID=UPI003FD04026